MMMMRLENNRSSSYRLQMVLSTIQILNFRTKCSLNDHPIIHSQNNILILIKKFYKKKHEHCFLNAILQVPFTIDNVTEITKWLRDEKSETQLNHMKEFHTKYR